MMETEWRANNPLPPHTTIWSLSLNHLIVKDIAMTDFLASSPVL